ncbi:MAG: hypothetical protein ACI87N_002235 [Flavobacteriales bacterium]|jgi:hypothetical protein
MKTSICSTVALLLFCNFCYCQSYKTTKIIVDKNSKRPLEAVNVYNEFDNTITNGDGKFVFFSKKDSINISSVGYQTVATTFGGIATRDTLFLEPSINELEEIVVVNTSFLLNDVYRSVAGNYPSQPFREKFFLRCVLKKNNQICRLQDMSAKIESNALFLNQTVKNKEFKLEVLNLRKADIEVKKQIEYFEFLSTKTLFSWFASIFTVPFDYIFTKAKSNDPQYVKIEYSKSDTNANILSRNGYYLINREDKSIKEVGYKLQGDLTQIPYQSKLGVKWRTIEIELVVNYIKSAKNNKYYVSNAKLRTVTEVINEKKGVNDTYECIYDLVTVDGFIEELVKPNFSVTKDLFKANFSYSEDFWKTQNQLPLTAELKLFLTRVNETKAVKSDFKIQSNF